MSVHRIPCITWSSICSIAGGHILRSTICCYPDLVSDALAYRPVMSGQFPEDCLVGIQIIDPDMIPPDINSSLLPCGLSPSADHTSRTPR